MKSAGAMRTRAWCLVLLGVVAVSATKVAADEAFEVLYPAAKENDLDFSLRLNRKESGKSVVWALEFLGGASKKQWVPVTRRPWMDDLRVKQVACKEVGQNTRNSKGLFFSRSTFPDVPPDESDDGIHAAVIWISCKGDEQRLGDCAKTFHGSVESSKIDEKGPAVFTCVKQALVAESVHLNENDEVIFSLAGKNYFLTNKMTTLDVACRHLHTDDPFIFGMKTFDSQGSVPAEDSLLDLDCTGTENDLFQCRHVNVGFHVQDDWNSSPPYNYVSDFHLEAGAARTPLGARCVSSRSVAVSLRDAKDWRRPSPRKRAGLVMFTFKGMQEPFAVAAVQEIPGTEGHVLHKKLASVLCKQLFPEQPFIDANVSPLSRDFTKINVNSIVSIPICKGIEKRIEDCHWGSRFGSTSSLAWLSCYSEDGPLARLSDHGHLEVKMDENYLPVILPRTDDIFVTSQQRAKVAQLACNTLFPEVPNAIPRIQPEQFPVFGQAVQVRCDVNTAVSLKDCDFEKIPLYEGKKKTRTKTDPSYEVLDNFRVHYYEWYRSYELPDIIRAEFAFVMSCDVSQHASPIQERHARISPRGWIEVSLNGRQWISVSMRGFGETEATVFCRTIGYKYGYPISTSNLGLMTGVPLVTYDGFYGTVLFQQSDARGQIQVGFSKCTGLEKSFLDCVLKIKTEKAWSRVGASCTNKRPPPFEKRIRIASGSTNRLQVLVDGVWGTVCRDHFSSGMADFACFALGYKHGRPVSRNELTGPPPSVKVPIHLNPRFCPVDSYNFFQCDRALLHQCQSHDLDVGIVCYDDPDNFLTMLPSGELMIHAQTGLNFFLRYDAQWSDAFSTRICQSLDPTYVWGEAKPIWHEDVPAAFIDCPSNVTTLEACTCRDRRYDVPQTCTEFSKQVVEDSNSNYLHYDYYSVERESHHQTTVGLVCHHTARPALVDRVRILPDGILQVRQADEWRGVLTIDERRASTICNAMYPGTSPVLLSHRRHVDTDTLAIKFNYCGSGDFGDGDFFACFEIHSFPESISRMTCVGAQPVRVEISDSGRVVVEYGEAIRSALASRLVTREDASVLCRTWTNESKWIGVIINNFDDGLLSGQENEELQLQCAGHESHISECPGFRFDFGDGFLDPNTENGALHVRCILEQATSSIRWNNTTGLVHVRTGRNRWLPVGVRLLGPELPGHFAWNVCRELGFVTGELRHAATLPANTPSLVIDECPRWDRFSPFRCMLKKADAPTLMRIRCSNTTPREELRLSNKHNIVEVYDYMSKTWRPACSSGSRLGIGLIPASIWMPAPDACSQAHPDVRGKAAVGIVPWSTEYFDDDVLWEFPMKFSRRFAEKCDSLYKVECGLQQEENLSLDQDGWTLRIRIHGQWWDDYSYWVGICSDWRFGDAEASMACTQLGYTTGFVLPDQPTSSSIRFTPFVRAKSRIKCAPDSKTLSECDAAYEYCKAHPVRVACFTPLDLHKSLLKDGRSKQLHIVLSGVDTAICADRQTFGQNEVDVACRSMGFDSGALLPMEAHPFPKLNLGTDAISHVSCKGTERRIADCSFRKLDGQCTSHFIGVVCSSLSPANSLARLGPDGKRFEMFMDNRWWSLRWRTVTDQSATVACRMLGKARGTFYPPATEASPQTYEIPTMTWGFECNGSETTLFNCKRVPNFQAPFTSCPSKEQCNRPARINCSDDHVPDPFIRISQPSNLVQVFDSSLWGQVCGNVSDTTATVACRQLGYTSGTLLYATVSNLFPDFIRDPLCTGFEDSLFQCPSYRGSGANKLCPPGTQALSVACSGPTLKTESPKITVKLDRDGIQLLVFRNGTWGTVGVGTGFDTIAATVACKQMGFALGKVVFDWTNRPEWDPSKAHFTSVHCQGDEGSLFDCAFETEKTGELDTAVGLECIPNAYVQDVAFRLDARGYVMMKGRDQDEFLPVVSPEPTLVEARVACRTLGFSTGGLLPFEEKEIEDHVIFLDRCAVGSETSLLQCDLKHPQNTLHLDTIFDVEYAGSLYDESAPAGYSSKASLVVRPLRVSCEDELDRKVRLVGYKNNKRRGRLEIRTASGYKSICPDGVTAIEATVACRQLQLGEVGIVVVPQLDNVDLGKIDELRCSGSESALDQCQFTDRSDCAGALPLEIRCERSVTQAVQVRLSSNGRLEFSLGNQWGSVCRTGFGEEEARLSCHTLGYETGELTTAKRSSEPMHMMVDQVTCTGLEESVLECAYSTQVRRGCKQWGWKKEVFLTCYNRVPLPGRLVRTRPVANFEIVEIYNTDNRKWMTICSHITPHTAQLLCRAMGFEAGATAPVGQVPATSMAQTKLWCPNDVDVITECSRSHVDQCTDNRAATVVCKNMGAPETASMSPARLSESMLEVLIFGTSTYGTVCAVTKPFGGREAVVACRMLGMATGHPVAVTSNRKKSQSTPVAMQDVSCRGSEQSLRQCNSAGRISSKCKQNLPVQGVQCFSPSSAVFLGSKRVAALKLGGKLFRIKQTVPYLPGGALRVAKVLCRMIGFSDYLNVRFVHAKKGQDFGMLEGVECTGDEVSILDCVHSLKVDGEDKQVVLSVECTSLTSAACQSAQTQSKSMWQKQADADCPSPSQFQSMTLSCACEYFAGGKCQKLRNRERCESIASAGKCSWFGSFCGLSFNSTNCLHRYNEDTLADLIREEASIKVGAESLSLPVLPSETDSSQCPSQCEYEKRQLLCVCDDYWSHGNSCRRRHKMKNCPTELGCWWVGDTRKGVCLLQPNDASVKECPWYHSHALKTSLVADGPVDCASLGPSTFWFQFGRSRLRAGVCLPTIH